MINTGVISYGSGAILFLVLTLVLLTGQHGRSRKNALKFAAVVSTVWLTFPVVTIYYEVSFYSYLVEPIRSFSWLLFLGFVLVSSITDTRLADQRFRKAAVFAASYTVLLTTLVLYRIFAGAGVAGQNFSYDELVSNTDLMPTLCDLLELSVLQIFMGEVSLLY